MLLKQLLNLQLVALEDGSALAIELTLNLVQLHVVVLPHLVELVLHALYQQIYILRHLLNRLDVVAVLLIDLPFELFDQLLLVGDDLGAGRLLRLYVLGQLLTVFLLLKLLPIPIDLDVLLVGLDHLILNFICAFLFSLLLASAPVFVQLLRVRLDLDQHLLSLSPDLLNLALGLLDLAVTVVWHFDILLHEFLVLA